jgi:hypothetical protein
MLIAACLLRAARPHCRPFTVVQPLVRRVRPAMHHSRRAFHALQLPCRNKNKYHLPVLVNSNVPPLLRVKCTQPNTLATTIVFNAHTIPLRTLAHYSHQHPPQQSRMSRNAHKREYEHEHEHDRENEHDNEQTRGALANALRWKKEFDHNQTLKLSARKQTKSGSAASSDVSAAQLGQYMSAREYASLYHSQLVHRAELYGQVLTPEQYVAYLRSAATMLGATLDSDGAIRLRHHTGSGTMASKTRKEQDGEDSQDGFDEDEEKREQQEAFMTDVKYMSPWRLLFLVIISISMLHAAADYSDKPSITQYPQLLKIADDFEVDRKIEEGDPFRPELEYLSRARADSPHRGLLKVYYLVTNAAFEYLYRFDTIRRLKRLSESTHLFDLENMYLKFGKMNEFRVAHEGITSMMVGSVAMYLFRALRGSTPRVSGLFGLAPIVFTSHHSIRHAWSYFVNGFFPRDLPMLALSLYVWHSLAQDNVDAHLGPGSVPILWSSAFAMTAAYQHIILAILRRMKSIRPTIAGDFPMPGFGFMTATFLMFGLAEVVTQHKKASREYIDVSLSEQNQVVAERLQRIEDKYAPALDTLHRFTRGEKGGDSSLPRFAVHFVSSGSPRELLLSKVLQSDSSRRNPMPFTVLDPLWHKPVTTSWSRILGMATAFAFIFPGGMLHIFSCGAAYYGLFRFASQGLLISSPVTQALTYRHDALPIESARAYTAMMLRLAVLDHRSNVPESMVEFFRERGIDAFADDGKLNTNSDSDSDSSEQ